MTFSPPSLVLLSFIVLGSVRVRLGLYWKLCDYSDGPGFCGLLSGTISALLKEKKIKLSVQFKEQNKGSITGDLCGVRNANHSKGECLRKCFNPRFALF